MTTTPCPGLEFLVDLMSDEPTSKPELRAHVASCSRCLRAWTELQAVRAGLSDSLSIPPRWTDRIVQRLPSAPRPEPQDQASAGAALVTAALSALTVLMTSILLTPAGGSGSTGWQLPAALALLVGGVAAFIEARSGRWARLHPGA